MRSLSSLSNFWQYGSNDIPPFQLEFASPVRCFATSLSFCFLSFDSFVPLIGDCFPYIGFFFPTIFPFSAFDILRLCSSLSVVPFVLDGLPLSASDIFDFVFSVLLHPWVFVHGGAGGVTGFNSSHMNNTK